MPEAVQALVMRAGIVVNVTPEDPCTTTLFAALNVLDGTVIGHNMKRHRHQEFIRFLNAIEAQVPKRKPSTPSSTTTPLTNIPRFGPGWLCVDWIGSLFAIVDLFVYGTMRHLFPDLISQMVIVIALAISGGLTALFGVVPYQSVLTGIFPDENDNN